MASGRVTMDSPVQEFPDRRSASIAAADIIEAAVQRRLSAADEATLVVSGGTTPDLTFGALAGRDLHWSRIHIVPSDERWVPPDHEDSNERLVRSKLMVNGAADAMFQPLFIPDCDPEAGARELDRVVHKLPFPFACALLGMGEDGHFASLFPGVCGLENGLNTDGANLVVPIRTGASPHPRISLTLAALSRSDEIVLLMFGSVKRAVVEQAVVSVDGLPVAHLLRQKRAPVHILWAP